MSHVIPGLHHVTCICAAPQPNIDFYVGVLGQRFVKKTVNFDAPDVYHLYYADDEGTPGTVMTFFPFLDAGPGRTGRGAVSAVAYAIPEGGHGAWQARLEERGLAAGEPIERFGDVLLAISDPNGLAVELIESPVAAGSAGETHAALDGFHSVSLCSRAPERTVRVLTEIFGYDEQKSERQSGVDRTRFRSPAGGRASVIDVVEPSNADAARQGAGSVHHIAFRAESDDVQLQWRERLQQAGFEPTPVIDRQYFNAIYFREPGGVLFEIATDPPGFTADEPLESLGESLKLPEQYESRREELSRALPPITLPPRG